MSELKDLSSVEENRQLKGLQVVKQLKLAIRALFPNSPIVPRKNSDSGFVRGLSWQVLCPSLKPFRW
jgi:hypothetical protein